MKEAITAAAAAVRAAAASQRQRPRRRRRRSQAASSLGGPVQSCFRRQVHAVVLASEPGASRRDGKRQEGHRFGSLKLIGCLKRRLLPPLRTLQWECGSSRTPAVALLPMPKARRRYRNLTVWLPPHVTSAAAVPGRRLRRPSVVVAVVAAASVAAAAAAFAATAAHRRHRPLLHRRPPANRRSGRLPLDAPPPRARPHRPTRCHHAAASAAPVSVHCVLSLRFVVELAHRSI